MASITTAMKMVDKTFCRYSVAIVTPFVSYGSNKAQPVDSNALKSCVDHVSNGLSQLRSLYPGDIGGIIASGSTGEQHSMTVEERISIYGQCVQYASKFDVPVAAGVSGSTTENAVELAKGAIKAGCTGIMLAPPPYLRLSPEEIRQYILAVKAVIPPTLPLLLYNNAGRNGYGPPVELIIELFRSGVIWGMKYAPAGGEEALVSDSINMLQVEPTLRLYTGGDKLALDLLDCDSTNSYLANYTGAADLSRPLFYGLTSIVGNLRTFDMGSAVIGQLRSAGKDEGDNKGFRTNTQQEQSQLVDSIRTFAAGPLLTGCSLPTGLKFGLRAAGVQGGYCRQPLGTLSPQQESAIALAVAPYSV